MDKGGKSRMDKKILIATPVHQDEDIFREFLFSLNHLIIPYGYSADVFFILHNCPNLKVYLQEGQYTEINNDVILRQEGANGRKQWTQENYSIVAEMRTSLLKKAREEKYDYLFMVDSDVLLHPKTLKMLITDNKDIVSSLSWTKPNLSSNLEIPCGMDEGWGVYKDVSFALNPALYAIGWTGRCTLISSRIFNNPNISYYQIPGVDNTGSEDYAFCLRCYCNFPDLEICMETRFPSRHLYNKKEYYRWMTEKAKYFKEKKREI